MNRLWSVTSFFNPARYEGKLKNYRTFRQHLATPLVTVELAYGPELELAPNDADILIQLRGGDVLWQKERLLNIAIERLPAECEYVAWIDCDVILSRSDWPEASMRELDRAGICHLFRTVHHLRPEAPIEKAGAGLRHESIGYACSQGLKTSVAGMTDGVPNVYKRGNAWAARRELVRTHGLYDRCVIGGGDKFIAFAVTGQADEVVAHDRLPAGHARDYLRWAEGFQRDARRVGYLEGDIFHLWHGDLLRRRYSERHRILAAFDYDPAKDIALDEQECWRWSSDKPEMHRQVQDYFVQRAEDGPA